ncbi:MAG: hypothetical protein ABSF64_06725 [Bryobacteraceae bacterium]
MRLSHCGYVMAMLAASLACAQGPATVVPRLVQFSGTLKDASGKPLNGTLTGTVGLTIGLYVEADGGTPLWCEAQNVTPDARGRYSVLLGATQAEGLPLDLFASGQARWLGVAPQLAGAAAEARVLLVVTPYALKAADADTLGGMPASAFLLASGATAAAPSNAPATGASVMQPDATAAASPGAACTKVTSPGTARAGQLTEFTGACAVGPVATLFVSGGNLGIGNQNPADPLDVTGLANFRNGLQAGPLGTATASGGFDSAAYQAVASAFNKGTSAAVNQRFQWQAEPAGNDTATPSATLNLLFGEDPAAPAETGLSISGAGIFTFAPGQTFPGGGSGTINGVTAGTDLTGGGTTGTVTLNLDTTKVPQLAAANSFTGNQSVAGSVTATGTVSASQLVSNVAAGTPPLAVTSTTQVPNLNASLLGGVAATSFAGLGSNTFAGNQTIDGALTGTSGSFTASGSGTILSVAQTGTGNGFVASTEGSRALEGDALATSGATLGVIGTNASSGGIAVSGSANAATGSTIGVAGTTVSTGGTGVQGLANATSGSTIGVLGQVSSPAGIAGVFNSAGGGLILSGKNNGTQVFSVNGGGTVALAGITFGNGTTQTTAATGTISGVTAGTDLTGGGTSGALTLNLDITKVPQLATANSFSGNQSVAGNVTATGTLSGGQLVSNAAVGTPPLVVGSATQVQNLNASFLGGIAAGGFATTGANSFFGNQTIPGIGAISVLIGNVGCGATTAGISFSGSSCTNYALLSDTTGTTVNRPLGQTIRFREGNGGDQVEIQPGGNMAVLGGNVTIASNSTAASGLTVTFKSTSTATYAGSFQGDGSSGGLSATGGSITGSGGAGIGLIALGGGSTGSGNGGVGAAVLGGSAGDTGAGGEGLSVSGGDTTGAGNIGGVGISVGGGNCCTGSTSGDAGQFFGNVSVEGTLTASVKDFRIDHPLDPANKYLYHSSVESSEMMNIYTGNVTTDAQGQATVQLPDWFEALNADFRYQLTVIGQFAQAMVASEIGRNQFRIRTDKPNVKVSWQVTGVRQDAYAKAYPLRVEAEKPVRERGYYINPALYGAPAEKQVAWARNPGLMKRIQARREQASHSN